MKNLNIILVENEDGEKYIDVLYEGYNIICETIYDDEVYDRIMSELKNASQNGLDTKLK